MPLSLVGRRASALIASIGLATGIIASVTTCFAAALRAQDGGSALHRLTIAPMGGFTSYAPYYDRPISVDGNAVNFRLSVTDQAFVGAVARYDFPRSRWSLVASADRGKGKGRVDVCNKGN